MKTPTRTRIPQSLGDSRKYNTMCVCQICTCGKHRCPPNTHKPFVGQSTYDHDYKPCAGIINEIRKPCTNHYHERHYDPGLLKTTYDAQYTPHKIENPQYDPSSKYEYRPRSGKFYGETEYNNNFKPKQISREQMTPKQCVQPYMPRKTRFQGTTTYKTEYSPKKADNNFVPQNYTYERKKVPFEGKTTYNTEYKPHKVEPTWKGCCGCGNNCNCNSGCKGCSNGCKCGVYVPRSGRFEGESNYKANYKPYELQREGHCPILDLPQYPRECSPGKTHLNYSAEKNKWY